MTAGRKLRLVRRYWFEAAHRLFVPGQSDEQNMAMFGKCARPGGHGHNYEIELILEGEPDPETGEIVDRPELDARVDALLLSRVDHRCLDDVVDVVSTGENLAILFADWLRPAFTGRARLVAVRVRETRNNFFESPAV